MFLLEWRDSKFQNIWFTRIFFEQADKQKGCTFVMQIARPTNSYKKAHNAITFAGFSYIGNLDKAL